MDKQLFRPNVGIVLLSPKGQVFWARRLGKDMWQFPQGGIQDKEPLDKALYRELYEEVGLKEHEVSILAKTKNEVRYLFQKPMVREDGKSYVGQSQRWFLLRLEASEAAIRLDASEDPEFDQWRWVDYWYPLEAIVEFKREVYRSVLNEFAANL